MGQVITKLAEEDTDVEIVAGVDPFDDGHNSYPVLNLLCRQSPEACLLCSNQSVHPLPWLMKNQ